MFFVRFFLEVIKIDLLGYNLCVTAKKFSQLLTEKFKEYEITPEQWVIVRILFESDIQLSQKELAIKSQKDQNTVTAIIDKLEKKGYVERVKSNEDKRIFNIILKEKIKKNIKILYEIDENLTKEICKNLTQVEIDNLEKSLKSLSNEIDIKLKTIREI
ncbi:MarR family transcriptional regulator [Fusobacterium mortiferum]|jgi:DNA-binding MarR family transcriptional regulator|uniref:MarR family transcriptional regulator n=1 Tax=Fusobacterium mortiferum TaxID=850 RepID=A0A414PXL5_FUSMR|nr:MarR family transcriptional regulator [Fusobacterium mortiferum]RHF73250.1 MarR family transcriptional regulator [Fusobacterium mortiferum]